MSRTRNSLLTAAVAASLIIATGLPLGAVGPPGGGFLLTGADAAYADWEGESIGECTGDLFVGYVDAVLTQLPLGSRPFMPHSDVQAILRNVDCDGAILPELEGTVQATSCATADMVSLESAEVVCTVTVTNGPDTADVAIALTWTTTTGDIFICRPCFNSSRT